MHKALKPTGRQNRLSFAAPAFYSFVYSLALFAPAFLSGCMAGGGESLTTLIRPGALAQDMNDPGPPVLARLQQPDNPDIKPKPPADAPPPPPSTVPVYPGLVPPSTGGAMPLPGSPGTRGDMILVRAWVNGKPLYDDEFKMTYFQVPGLLNQLNFSPNDPKTKEMLADARNKVIDNEIMYQDAISKLENAKTPVLEKLKKDAEKKYDEQMRNNRENFKKTYAGLSPGQYQQKEAEFLEYLRDNNCLLRRKAEREFISSEYMRSRIVPRLLTIIGPKEIKDEYDSHMNMYVFPGKIQWQDIFIPQDKEHPTVADTRRFAESLLAKYRNDFQGLQQYNQGDSKHRGGDGVGTHPSYKVGDKIIPTDIRPIEMEAELAKLREGQSAIVETPGTGVHIIRLVKFEPSKQREFTQEVQTEIRNRLRNEVFEREYKHLIRELRSRADIVIVAD